MKKLRHYYWKLFGQPDVPPQDFPILPHISEYTGKSHFLNYQLMNIDYRNDFTLEEISKLYNVTRERVRQCLWKNYWRYYHNR